MSLSKSQASALGLSGESGIALLEFAFALPIFVLLFLFSLEYVRALQSQQSMAVLTREAANGAFRDCLELDEMDDCLDVVHGNLSNAIDATLPGAELIISVYTYDDKHGTVPGVVKMNGIRPAGGVIASGKKSKYTVDTFKTTQRGLIVLHQKIAIAEIFYEFTPLFAQPIIGSSFYDAAIY